MWGERWAAAFGGKSDLHADAITALLALKTGRPCKWRWTREEEMLYSLRHSPWRITFKDGVKKDGRIVARLAKSIHDAGAYTGMSSYVVNKHCFYLAGPYYLPNVRVQCTGGLHEYGAHRSHPRVRGDPRNVCLRNPDE